MSRIYPAVPVYSGHRLSLTALGIILVPSTHFIFQVPSNHQPATGLSVYPYFILGDSCSGGILISRQYRLAAITDSLGLPGAK
jgi:hypothetical protein